MEKYLEDLINEIDQSELSEYNPEDYECVNLLKSLCAKVVFYFIKLIGIFYFTFVYIKKLFIKINKKLFIKINKKIINIFSVVNKYFNKIVL